MIRRRRPLLQPRKKLQRIWRSKLYIREYRQAHGLSLTEFAKAIGKTKGMVSQIENRQSAASSKTLEDIADFFGLPHPGLLFEPPVPKGWRRIVSIVPKNGK